MPTCVDELQGCERRDPHPRRRYFRRKFELVGTPMAIELRTGRNPYAGKAKDRRGRK
jgi:hypothetical protein